MGLSRLALYGLVSTTLFAWTVLNAFRQRSNFYAAAVYLSKSNACIMIMWNQGIFQTVLLGKALQAIFLGELRLIEIERLQERGWFAVTETLLALTIFKEEFESSFVMLFVSLLFFKVFHWLASDRVEMMEQTARVSRAAHARMVGLLSLLWVSDVFLMVYAIDSILFDGPTVMIMFASEYMILLANVWSTTAKYIINVIDMRREEPWEDKSIYVFYVELAADFFKLFTYLTFFGLILTFYGLPLNILRDVYLTLRSFLLKIRDLRRYRQATRNMDTLYPNATREEMAAMTDKTCIICREDMEYRPGPGEEPLEAAEPAQEGQQEQPPVAVAEQHQQPPRGPNDTPKKLPCGHVFHFHCLRSWLERQQSCPTCRRPVLPQEQPPPPAAGQPPQQQQAQEAGGAPPPAAAGGAPPRPRDPRDAAADEAIRQAQVNIARNLGREAFGVIFPDIPFPAEAEAGPGGTGRLPRPPAQGGPTLAPPPVTGVEAANVPLPPSPLPTPTPTTPAASAATPVGPASYSPVAGGSATNPLLSPPATAATPSAPAAAGAGADNPLARFSLPNLPVPSTGEAGLYQPPPSFTYPSHPSPSTSSSSHAGFSNLAYGAYPQFTHLGTAGGLPPPPAGSAQAAAARQGGMVNIEERVREARRRWVVDGVASASVEGNGVGGEEKKEEGGARRLTREEKGKGKAIEEEKVEETKVEENKESSVDDSEEGLTPREAALRAAERRANKGREREHVGLSSNPSTAPTTSSRPALKGHESNETIVPSAVAPFTSQPSIEVEASTSTVPSAPISGASAVPSSASSLPRLIPLFDPSESSTSAASLSLSYPHLFPSAVPTSADPSTAFPSLLPSNPTAEQLGELDRLTRAGIEERLRLLVGFQERLEGLVEEMRGAIGGESTAGKVTERQEGRMDVVRQEKVDTTVGAEGENAARAD
ncbi:hypothetical protein JCM11251_005497 [Rhodosporidiobolus azoricus]